VPNLGYNAHEFLFTYEQALDYYHQDDWNYLVKSAMESDYSWKQSASVYKIIYEEISQW